VEQLSCRLLPMSKSYPVCPVRWVQDTSTSHVPCNTLRPVEGPRMHRKNGKGGAGRVVLGLGSNGIERAASSRTLPVGGQSHRSRWSARLLQHGRNRRDLQETKSPRTPKQSMSIRQHAPPKTPLQRRHLLNLNSAFS